MAVFGHILPEISVLAVMEELAQVGGVTLRRLYSSSGELLATHDPRVGNGCPDWFGKPANQQAREVNDGGVMVWKM